MWKSRVEIEGYIPSRISVASLPSKRRIAELPVRAGTSGKDGDNSLNIHASMEHI